MNNKIVELATKNILPTRIPCPKHPKAYTEVHGDNGDTILLMYCEKSHYFNFDVLGHE